MMIMKQDAYQDRLAQEEVVHAGISNRQVTVQVHLRLSKTDRDLLVRIASQREQTLSGAVRYLLKTYGRTASR